MDDLASDMLAQSARAVEAGLPGPSVQMWQEALRRLLASRARPGTEAMQEALMRDLRQSAKTMRFIEAEGGILAVADPPGDRPLAMLRVGGLWFRGGDVEAELLQLLGELGS